MLLALIALIACSSLGIPQGGGSESAHENAAGGLVYLFPTKLPSGMELTGLRDYNLPRKRKEPGAYGAVVGIKQSETEFTDLIHVLVHEARTDREVGDDESQYEMVNINGATARFADHELSGANVDWFQDGLAIGVIGPSGARKGVMGIARALRLPRSGDATEVRLGRLPEGKTLIAERSVGSYRGASYSFGSDPTGDGMSRTLLVDVFILPEDAIAPEAAAPGTDRLRYLTIRGATAAAASTSHELSSPGGTVPFDSTSVAWLEYPDVLVTIIAGGLDEEEIVAFAEGLEEARTEREWRSHFDS